MPKKIAIIGAGLTGLTLAKKLTLYGHSVDLFDPSPLGIANYRIFDGIPVHHVGGHCLSTKRPKVVKFVDEYILAPEEWTEIERLAVVALTKDITSKYPIEMNIDPAVWPAYLITQIKAELNYNLKLTKPTINTLYDQFIYSFGKTLTDMYFEPYNNKIWCENIKNLDYHWVKDKTPQVSISQILENINIKNSLGFNDTDHATFRYPIIDKTGRNLFLDNFSKLHTVIKKHVVAIERIDCLSRIKTDDGLENFYDDIVYTGTLSALPSLLNVKILNADNLHINPVTVTAVRGPKQNFSWKYIPDEKFCFHRIINMSYFAKHIKDSTNIFAIETTGEVTSKRLINDISSYSNDFEILELLKPRPGYVKFKPEDTLAVNKIKTLATENNVHLCGRFATWSYDNADICIDNALSLAEKINEN